MRIKENVAGAYKKPELYELDDATDFEYAFEEWLEDFITAYIAAKRYEEASQLAKEVKEIFAWEECSPVEYNREIGTALSLSGKQDEADAWYESWLEREPDNFGCVYECAVYFFGRGQKERAERLIEDALTDVECNYETQDYFMYAASFFSAIGNAKKAAYYKKIEDDFFQKFLKNPTKYSPEDAAWCDDDIFFGQEMEPEKTVIKEKKIYPNDPCPCGSGKKYKKCCGRK